MLKEETAKYIWDCIQNHSDGFSEDREEWLYALDIEKQDMEDFIILVNAAIAALEQRHYWMGNYEI